MCAYMEVWHLDFEQYIELKKIWNERRRAHDINTACWIPDLFMQRLQNKEDWTFSVRRMFLNCMIYTVSLKRNMNIMNH